MILDDFLKEMMSDGSMWDQIMVNIIGGDKKLKRALCSEIALSFLERREKIETLLRSTDFKYYFIRTVLNQIKSKTSSLYKNYKKTIANSEEFDFAALNIVDEDDILKKIENEEKLDKIDQCLKEIKIGWFGSEMFRLYYVEDMTYREIEKNYGINHLTVWNEVKKVKQKINKWNGNTRGN